MTELGIAILSQSLYGRIRQHKKELGSTILHSWSNGPQVCPMYFNRYSIRYTRRFRIKVFQVRISMCFRVPSLWSAHGISPSTRIPYVVYLMANILRSL